jgi:hypothetical protein
MLCKYFPKNNSADFSSGRVILHKPRYPNYPVALEHIDKTKTLCICDPCCGGGYMPTVF